MKLLGLWLSLTLASITIDLNWRSLRSYNQLDKEKHHSLSSSRNISDDHSYLNSQSGFYYAELSLGTPLQNYDFLIDINAAWTWVDSIKSQTFYIKHQFNSKLSTSFSNSTHRKDLKSHERTISGYLSTENFAVNNFLIENQPFILVDNHSDSINIWEDGTLGLGFDSSNQISSYISTLQIQGKILKKQFSLFLTEEKSSNSILKSLGSSNIMIGGEDLFKYSSESEFTYISLVNTSKFWEVPCDSVIFGGAVYLEGNAAVFETVSSEIAGPETAISDILKILSTDYGCEVDIFKNYKCKCGDKFPDMRFSLEGHPFSIKYSEYMNEVDGICYPMFKTNGGVKHWSLGTSFLKNFYISFDIDNKQIGLAKAKILTDTSNFKSLPIFRVLESDLPLANTTKADANQVSAVPNSTLASEPSNSSDLSTGEIILIVILPSVVLIILFFIVKLLLWRRMKKEKEEENTKKPKINKSEEVINKKEEKEGSLSGSDEIEISHLSFDIGKEFSRESDAYEKENVHKFEIIKTDFRETDQNEDESSDTN